jgi:hypothetical protein
VATTTLLVEILVIGSLAQVWLVSVFIGLTGPTTLNPSPSQVEALKAFAPLFVVPVMSLAYAIGWVVNFAAERLFKLLFEERWRDKLFPNQALEYEVARILYLQRGSSELAREFVLDRHILRIARASVVNFFLIGASSIAYWDHLGERVTVGVIVLCVLISIASFEQWRSRYRSYYKRLGRAAKILASEPTHAA